MLLSLLLGVFATLIVFPETPMARTLHRVLVKPTALRLSRVRLGHILFAAALTSIGAVLLIAFEGEGIRMFSLLAPDAVSWFAMFDVTLFVDVFAMAVAIAATTRLKALKNQITARVRTALAPARSALRSCRQRLRRDKATTRPTRSDDPDPTSFPPFGAGYAFG